MGFTGLVVTAIQQVVSLFDWPMVVVTVKGKGYYGAFIHCTATQLRWPGGFRYQDPEHEYAPLAKAKAKSGAKAIGQLGLPKVPAKAKGGLVAPMSIGKSPASKTKASQPKGHPKVPPKVSWSSPLN